MRVTYALWGVADPEQLAALAELLDEYAGDYGITDDDAARNRLAERILRLFNEGVKPADIRRQLDSSPPLPTG